MYVKVYLSIYRNIIQLRLTIFLEIQNNIHLYISEIHRSLFYQFYPKIKDFLINNIKQETILIIIKKIRKLKCIFNTIKVSLYFIIELS